MHVPPMYAASKEVSLLSGSGRGVSSSGCAPTIVIAGMARSGTSHMRNFLSTFQATHVGLDVEDWSVGWGVKSGNQSAASEHWASNYECSAFPSLHRVASYPWLSASGIHLQNTAQNAPNITFVLILRDPVERFISSYYHLNVEERRRDLPKLIAWAGFAHWTKSYAFKDLHHAVGYRSAAPPVPYYTVDTEHNLQRVMLHAKGQLMVGVLEDLQPLKEQLVKKFGLSALPGGVVLGNPILKNENNGARRDELPLPPAVISAVVKVAQAKTNFTRVAALMSRAGAPTTDKQLCRLWHHTSGEKCDG